MRTRLLPLLSVLLTASTVQLATSASAQSPVLRVSSFGDALIGVSASEAVTLRSGFWYVAQSAAAGGANAPPAPAEIISPPDGTEFVLDDLDPDAPLTVSWTEGTDPDGDALAYRWQLAASADFATLLLDEDAGSDTEITTTLAAILAAVGDVPAGDTTEAWHRVVTSDGSASSTDAARLALVRLGDVAAEADGPAALALHAPRPNPFGARTTLAYDLPAPGSVRLAVLDVLGREVAVVVEVDRPAGRHATALDAAALPAGVYVVSLEAGGARLTRTVTRLR
ncbi:T9SS type A sorting domain-containing protein [Rubrivirga marina]|uniref:Secretion system C-terminal sorting domain-containing protein n=1 Tax=Rubrivirga marina TaxID=1196024 RepID=A0A271IXA2_9BACT|nr:T9SS type A sorting domain-containing protein [Rubrivirga marina]PAP75853.1 hypothetical protein BSZ37_05055 [Rubrivirga marina]